MMSEEAEFSVVTADEPMTQVMEPATSTTNPSSIENSISNLSVAVSSAKRYCINYHFSLSRISSNKRRGPFSCLKWTALIRGNTLSMFGGGQNIASTWGKATKDQMCFAERT